VSRDNYSPDVFKLAVVYLAMSVLNTKRNSTVATFCT